LIDQRSIEFWIMNECVNHALENILKVSEPRAVATGPHDGGLGISDFGLKHFLIL